MAGKSLFDLGSGKVTIDAGTGGSTGGNPKPSRGPERAPKSDPAEPVSISDAFGPSAADAAPDTDPEAPFGRFPDGTPRKRRPRGSGPASGPRKSATETKGDISGIESLLVSIHLMGAVALKQPGLALNEVEAKRLATAIQQVQAQYPFVIDAKTQAWINLAAIGGMVYVPRVIAVANAAKAGKAAKAKGSPQASASPEPQKSDPLSEAPVVAPNHKGPLTPAQLFGPAHSGG